MKRFEVLKDVYNAQQDYLASSSAKIKKIDFDNLIAQFFCPGPFFYYIIDSPSLTFEYCSPSTEEILGISIQNKSVDALLDLVHKDDFDFMLKSEKYVMEFLKYQVTPDKVLKYKIGYCIREKNKDGIYKLFLMQSIAIQTNQNGALLKVLGIHSDISHITNVNNYKLSLTGLDNEPSFLGINILNLTNSDEKTATLSLTKREIEVIRFMANGATAQEISELLFVSKETIITHKKNALKKANCKNSVQLVAYCIKNGLI